MGTKPDAPKRKTGRPSLYSRELADLICARLADGETLREICLDQGMPKHPTVHGWILDDIDGLSNRYMRAREIQCLGMADEILEIADDGRNDWMQREAKRGGLETVLDREHVERSRHRIETRKWLLSKLLSSVFGDRVNIDHTGKVSFESLVLQALGVGASKDDDGPRPIH